ncbi:APC family permease [Neobacillus drentensis]|uniref:APC family permease n=1 Tax=Neobacillus drentensis TaxID=220684 RepID=UPI001F2BCD82|nr:amino acid permease [Neobacillus drentensis]ULT58676.1 APC family permease [Neobacillus drentensis]
MKKANLNQRLTLFSVVMIGLSIMAPGTVFSTYGIASQITEGKVPAAYAVAAIALAFTAYSYGQMVKAYPTSGSAYTYVQQAFNPYMGFLIGWALFTDYLLLPMVNYLIAGIFISSVIPAIPSYVWILLLIGMTTVINIRGIKLVGVINTLLMVYSILVIVLFSFLSIKSVLDGTGTGTLFSTSPIFDSGHSFSLILAGASLLCFSFLGFDSITTLAEETIDPTKTIPKAIFIILITGALIFIGVSYISSMVQPDFTAFTNPDAAAVEMATMVGGNLFTSFFLGATLVGTFASGLAAQASVSRVLFAMGRDSMLPKKYFGYVHPRFNTPIFNIVLVGAISLLALVLSLTVATSFINFGALVAFLFVNLSVIAHYFNRKKERSVKGIVSYLILPLIGAGFIVWLLSGLNVHSIILGICWTVLGVFYLMYLVKFKGMKSVSLKFDENNTSFMD